MGLAILIVVLILAALVLGIVIGYKAGVASVESMAVGGELSFSEPTDQERKEK